MAVTRRGIARAGLGGAVFLLGAGGQTLAAGAIDSTVSGVRLGIGTGSLNPLPPTAPGADPIDTVVRQCVDCGVRYIELTNTLMEPALPGINGGGRIPDPLTPEWTASRPKLRDWRITAPLERFRQVRGKFDAAGLTLISYVFTFTSDFAPAEIDAVFRQADALGVEVISTNQTQTFMAKHLAPYAPRYRAKLAWHNHARVDDANEIASLESFAEALSYSPHYRINLDIGHFTAGDQDALAFLRRYHGRISHIHVKDRRRGNGPNVAWGQGDTPIVPVLRLIKEQRWPIYVVQEREYRGPEVGDPVTEVKKNIAFMRQALA